MKSRSGVLADPETIGSVKGYLARSFPHCRVEAFWTVDPVEYTFVAYDVRDQPICNVIVDCEVFQEYGPDAMREILDDLGLADSLRCHAAPQVRVTKSGHLTIQRPTPQGRLPAFPDASPLDAQRGGGMFNRDGTRSGASILAADRRSNGSYLKGSRASTTAERCP